MLQIRHKEINPIFGNIGYSIAFDERGKGYSKMMLKLGLEECEKLNLDKVMINCLVTNLEHEYVLPIPRPPINILRKAL